jgi:hypothetical protein
MTLQQTVTIPADRRLHLDWTLPETFSPGAAHLALTSTRDGHDADRFLARSHAERVRENWNDERKTQESLAFREGREPPSGEWINPLLGIAEDASLTVERFMEMQEEEIDLENEYDERRRRISEKYRSRSAT